MVADGRLSAACASLLCDALTEPTAENLSKLQDKHPSQDIPINLPPFEDVTQEKVDSKLVLKKNFDLFQRVLLQPQQGPELLTFFMQFK